MVGRVLRCVHLSRKVTGSIVAESVLIAGFPVALLKGPSLVFGSVPSNFSSDLLSQQSQCPANICNRQLMIPLYQFGDDIAVVNAFVVSFLFVKVNELLMRCSSSEALSIIIS
jgi:hypothetical protein